MHNSEMSEINDYKVNFDHIDSDTDDTHTAIDTWCIQYVSRLFVKTFEIVVDS